MRTYVLIEGHGETEAVLNLLARLAGESNLGLAPFESSRVPGIGKEDNLLKYVELVRAKRDAQAMLALRDDEDGCPKEDAPRLAARLRSLKLPFPSAVVLAYRGYESLFLPCIEQMAGQSFPGPGGPRSGLSPHARFEGDFEAKRGVKEWLTSQMPPGRAYKPTVDQLPMTRMVNFATIRARGLAWFGSLERALVFLQANLGKAGAVYPPGQG
jgi:hypothetical protein